MPLAAPPEVWAILAHAVEARAGLRYGPESAAIFAEKVSDRARERGFDAPLDYYYFLRYDPAGEAELDALVEALVVHESYFFRELEPLRALARGYLAPRVARGERPRVWCAACAMGEEPLTLAFVLDELGALGAVELVASDVSERALARARRGRFGRRSLRALPGDVSAWMEVRGDEAVVRPRLLAAVEFRRVNLVDDAAVAALGTFDAVICRNVLIYFGESTARAVVNSLAARLRPGAPLLVGASESLLRLRTALACEERGGAFFYVKGAAP